MMLSTSLVTSMLAVLIERQFIIFSILLRTNVQFCGFKRAMSIRNQPYNNCKMRHLIMKQRGLSLIKPLCGKNLKRKHQIFLVENKNYENNKIGSKILKKALIIVLMVYFRR